MFKLLAGFAELLKFPHPVDLNNKALAVATRLSLKPIDDNLLVKFDHATPFVNGQVAFSLITVN